MKWLTRKKLAVLGGLLITASAQAATISFDEFAADNTNGGLPANRYAALGATFVSTDDGSTWGGLGNGDPGNWLLHGTNGSIFSGFNGNSYGLTMLFSSDVSGFSLDASRANGSSPTSALTVQGWNNGALVESVTLNFGGLNTWSTFALASTVDEVRWFGTGSGFHPFGVDNINWTEANAVPEPGSLALLGLGMIGLLGRSRKAVKRKPV